MQLILDFESRSMIDLREVGSWRYAEDKSTEVLCANYQLREGPGDPGRWFVWSPFECCVGSSVQTDTHYLTKDIPPEIKALGTSDAPELIAANAEFEVAMLVENLGINVNPDRVTCTHAMASYFRLPPKLDSYARMLGLGCKLEEGEHLIHKFSIPDKNGFLTTPPPFMMDEFIRYCRHDVELTTPAYDIMRPSYHDLELDVYRWNLGVNMAGVPMDVDLLDKMQMLQAMIGTDIQVPESFPKEKLTNVPYVKDWLNSRGLKLDDLRKEGLEKINLSKIPLDVRQVIKARLSVSKASFDKLDAIKARLSHDHTIKGGHRPYGGHTGRFSSEGAQMQNFAKAPYGINVQACLDAVKANDLTKLCEVTKDRPADGLVACMRPLIYAGEGHTFIMADYGQIEARGAMWLAEDWKHVDMWADGKTDMYCLMASKLFGREITKADEKERDIGKRAVLSCCMQIGGSRFEEDAKEKYGIDLATMNLTGDAVVGAFRAEFPALSAKRTGLWYRLGKAILAAAQGRPQTINGIYISKTGQGHIMTRLKSGRCLFFRNVRIVEDDYGPGVTYDSWSTKIKQYVREKLYGGSLTDIYTQATASDLLRNAVLRMKADPESPKIRSHVHDSIMGRCRIEDVEKATISLKKHMLAVPKWAVRFPLKIDVVVRDRFMK